MYVIRVHVRLMQKEAQLHQRRRADKEALLQVDAAKKYEIGEEPAQFVSPSHTNFLIFSLPAIYS